MSKAIKEEDYMAFIVTGRLYNKKTRFRLVYSGEGSLRQALSINLWNGSIWGVSSTIVNKKTGKPYRKLLKRVIN